MIQEILDCLWIKKELLTLNKEEILTKLKDEPTLEYYCQNICKILEQDNFFFTSPDLNEKIREIVYEKRFSDHHNKELIANMNQMLDAVHRYRQMSDSEKKQIIYNWKKQEKECRNLPFRNLPWGIQDLYEAIKTDYDYAILLLGGFTKQDGSLFLMLSTTGWLCHNYPEFFDNHISITLARNACDCIKSLHIPYTKMAKEIEKKLDKIEAKQSFESNKIYFIKPNMPKD